MCFTAITTGSGSSSFGQKTSFYLFFLNIWIQFSWLWIISGCYQYYAKIKNQNHCAVHTTEIHNLQSIATQAMQHWMNCVYSQTKFWAQFVSLHPKMMASVWKSEIIIHSRCILSVAVAALISSAHSIKWWLERAWYGWYTFCCYFVYFVLVYGCSVCVCVCMCTYFVCTSMHPSSYNS